MRTYLILRDKAQRWNADAEIQALVRDTTGGTPFVPYSAKQRDALLGQTFDRAALSRKGLSYERLDQLTIDVLLGVR
jgi:xylose isomerase